MNKKTISLIVIGLFCIVLGLTAWFFLGGQIPILSPELTHVAAQTQLMEGMLAIHTAYAHDVETQVARMVSESSLTLVPPPSINSQNWIDKWLHNPTCQIPCWENITPGVTKITDAVKILTQIPGVHIGDTYSSVSWGFENNDGGSIDYDLTTYAVSDVELHVRERSLHVSELIGAYGEPTDVVIILCSEFCSYGLYYKDKGMLIELDELSNITIEITPETKIFRIYLFASSPTDWIAKVISSRNKIEWIGYGAYDFSSE
jgi:hypothetical protein